jgi:site-specific recombinase XerD
MPIDRRSILRMVKRRVKEVGIKKKITSHSFRESGATSIIERGGRMIDAQKFLDHKHIITTEGYIGASAVSSKKVVRKYHPLG